MSIYSNHLHQMLFYNDSYDQGVYYVLLSPSIYCKYSSWWDRVVPGRILMVPSQGWRFSVWPPIEVISFPNHTTDTAWVECATHAEIEFVLSKRHFFFFSKGEKGCSPTCGSVHHAGPCEVPLSPWTLKIKYRKPKIDDPKPQPANTKHQTSDTKHQTLNNKHQTPNTKHQTKNKKTNP